MEKTFYDLTSSQNSIWLTEEFVPNTSINNVAGCLYINELVNFDSLNKALNLYVEKNDAMRLRFCIVNGSPKQYLSSYSYINFDIINVNSIDEMKMYTKKSVDTPFNLIDSCLFRITIFKFPDGHGGFNANFHHLISDAWTMSLFISQVIKYYSDIIHSRDINLDANPSYIDYISSEQEYLTSNKFQKDKDFWDKIFDSEPIFSHISPKADEILDTEADRILFTLDPIIYSRINQFCTKYKCSIYTFFMAIYSIYIAKLNSNNSPIIGTPVLNRVNFKEKHTSGMFISTVPFKTTFTPNETFSDYLNNVALTQLGIFRHQKYPYDILLKDVKERYNLRENLYDLVLSYQNARDDKQISDIDYSSNWLFAGQISNSLEIHFYDMDNTGTLDIYYDYLLSKFSKDDIYNLHKRIMEMISTVLDNPQIYIKEISIITLDETQKFLNDFNYTPFEYDKELSLVEIFENNVIKNPEKTAVIFEDNKLTYSQLNNRANIIANKLLDFGIKSNDIVGIMLNRSYELLSCVWGILKIGAAYMLIDPSLPKDRIKYMISNSKSSLIITSLDINMDFEKQLLLNDINFNQISENPQVQTNNDDSLCIIYTSGSTGTPKGVELKRLSVINMLNSYKYFLNTDSCENFLSTSTVAFDMFIVENFVSLLSCKTVILANEEEQKIPAFTSKLISKYNVDFILSTPSKIELLLLSKETSSCLKNVKVIQLGGEVFKETLYNRLRACTNAKIFNGYGPSECTACASNKEIKNRNDITIGKTFLNTKIYILNDELNMLPIGYSGEMYISGDCVSKGYINRPDLTSNSFIPDMYSNGTMYKTGDIAKYSKNGDLLYIGRKDSQIKLRGLRIELEEITSKIVKLKNVIDAVSVIKKVNNIDSICSYVTTSSTITEREIKDSLKNSLPYYMIPSHIIFMESLPVTLNGKIDKNKLPDVNIKESKYIAPTTKTEKKLSKLWSNILKVDNISINSSFFDLGGDSLCSIKLVSEIYSSLNVKINIRDIFNNPTIKSLANYIDSLAETEKEYSIKSVKQQDYYPTSSAQKRIFYASSIDTNSFLYNISGGLLFDKMPDINKLENCINVIINRHEALRTSFTIVNEEIVQKIENSIQFNLIVERQSDSSIEDLFKDFVKPFDLNKAPLFRAKLVKLKNKGSLLLLDMHHIISDGTSLNIFIKELCDLYNEEELPEKHIDYKDFAVWENEQFKSKEFTHAKDFWLNQYKDEIPLLNMPTTYPRSSVQSFEGANYYINLNKDTFESINNVSKKLKVTPYMLMLSVFYILLSKYTSQDDIVIGTPIVGRELPELSDVMGMFVNTLALKYTINRKESFNNFAHKVKDYCLLAFQNQSYPFNELVKELNIKRDTSRNPLFDIMFIYQNDGYPEINFKNIKTKYFIPNSNVAKFDLSLEIIPNYNELSLRFEYCTKLFDEDFIEKFASHYINILNTILENTDITITDIDMLSEKEKNQILYNFNNTTVDYPRDKTIVDLFENQVEKTPDNIALVFEDQKLTYLELNEKANQLARYLVKNGVTNNSIVGIMLPRSLEMMISILGILKAGGAYLPIDPDYPSDRISYILADSSTPLLISFSTVVKELNCDTPIICLDTLKEELSVLPKNNLDTLISNKDLAYIIYTSGSTGKPKGVKLKHLSLSNLAYYCNNYVEYLKNNKYRAVVSITTVSFDIFIFETLISLQKGLKLVIANEKEQNIPTSLDALIEKENIEIIQTTPSRMQIFYNNIDSMPHFNYLKFITLAGEQLPISLVKNLKNATDCLIYNGYGPSETTVFSTLTDVTNQEKISIGKPLSNTQIYIINRDNQLCSIGVPGEICISGEGVGYGYINKENLTKKSFVANPFCSSSIMYKTGDLGYFDCNGQIFCLGRVDNQVKIRGLRIELEEIEKVILEDIKNIKYCTVIKGIDENNHEFLCAYFVKNGTISIHDIKNLLYQKLPNYMVPQYFMELPELPYTPNGKIDKKRLPTPKIKLNKKTTVARNDIDTVLIDIFKKLLGLDIVNIEDSLYDLGGDSLTAINLATSIYNKLGITVTIKDIFQHPTIQDLSDYISSLSKTRKDTIRPAAQKDYYPVSSAQKRIYYASILDNNSVLYNVTGGIIIDKPLNINLLKKCINKLIERHESLRTHFSIIENNIVQIIDNTVDFDLSIEEANYENLNDIYNNFSKPFNLAKAPLFRCKIIKFDNDKMFLLLDIHHIISDGTSLNIFIKELCDLYNEKELPEKQIDYKDFAVWEKEQFKTKEFSTAKEFWLEQYKEEIPLLNMPTTNNRPSVQSFEGANYYINLNKHTFENINDISKKLEITPYMLMLSAFYILLSKYTSQDDIVVGTPIIGRELPELSNIIGMFVNTLALRNTVNHNSSFKDFANNIKNYCLSAFKNQSYPFDELVKELDIKRDSSRSPLFDIMFIYQNNGYPDVSFKDVKSKYFIPDSHFSKFDLSLEILPDNDELSLRFEYCTKLFDKDFIERFASHYINILNTVLKNTNITIADIDMLSENEKNQILYNFNNTTVDYPRDKTIVDLFEEQAEKTPNKIAVIFENQELTYQELNEKANQLARYLIKNGVTNNSVVGIMLPRSLEIIVAFLAVLKTGACYIPIDQNFPNERIEYMLENSNTTVLLKLKDTKEVKFKNTINIDIDNSAIYGNYEKSNLSININPNSPSYIIYTSGSTGKPKGVVLTHKSLMNLTFYLNNVVDYFKTSQDIAIASITTMSFDIFLFETIISLQKGLKVVIANEAQQTNPNLLDDLIYRHNIKAIQMTPSRMDIFINNKEYMPHLSNLEYVTLAGEPLPNELRDKLLTLGNITVYNGYGPSETTVFSTFTNVTKHKKVNIGKPLANTYVYILDKDKNLCPIGIPGELYISGDGVGKGYINNQDLTDKSFVKDIFNPNLIMYKTGDLVKFLPNGELDYIGRVDNQVKIRGLRIELDEIEKWIMKYDNINKVVLSSSTDKNGRQYLVAYMTVNNRVSINELKIYLGKHIPKYMIPTYFMILDKFPYLPNGKINKKVLPLPNEDITLNKKFVAPTNNLEIKICQIFEKLLSISPISIYDNFFDIGGDSLLAMALQLELLKLNIHINYSDIFIFPTVKDLANYISSNSKKSLTKINVDEVNKFDSILQNTINMPTKLEYTSLGNILLTGVTGFLGAHILSSILTNEKSKVYCLIRTEPGLTIEQKLLNKLHYYFDNKYDNLIGTRIIPVQADMTVPNLGLSQSTLKELSDDINIVINSAAKVSHYGNYGDYKKINVDGTQNLVDFCLQNNKRFYQVSTLSVSGNSFIDDSYIEQNFKHDIDFNENNFYINQSLDNVYIRSKFEAEKIVLNNILNGLDGYILRIGNLMNRFSDGKFQPNVSENAYINRLISYYKIGCIPNYLLDSYLELTPVDCCANAILKLLQYNSKTNRIFHLLNHKNIDVEFFINTLNKFYDKINIVDNEVFLKAIDKILVNPNDKDILSGLINDFDENRKIVYSSPVKIKSDFTVRYLNKIGFDWPDLKENYIIKFISFFNNLNLLNRKDDI